MGRRALRQPAAADTMIRRRLRLMPALAAAGGLACASAPARGFFAPASHGGAAASAQVSCDGTPNAALARGDARSWARRDGVRPSRRRIARSAWQFGVIPTLDLPIFGVVQLEIAQSYAAVVIIAVIIFLYYVMGNNIFRIFFSREFDYDADVLQMQIRGGSPASADALTRQFGNPEKKKRLKMLRGAEQERAVLRAAGDEIPKELEEKIRQGKTEFPTQVRGDLLEQKYASAEERQKGPGADQQKLLRPRSAIDLTEALTPADAYARGVERRPD